MVGCCRAFFLPYLCKQIDTCFTYIEIALILSSKNYEMDKTVTDSVCLVFRTVYGFLSVASDNVDFSWWTLSLEFTLDEEGTPIYCLKRAGKDVLLPSRLGLVLKNAPSLVSGFAFYEKYGVH